MSDRPAVGRFASLLGLLTGLGAVALGVGLVRRAESAFGLTWASLMVVLGVIVLLSFVSQLPASSRPAPASSPTPWQGEKAEFFPRRTDRARLIGLVILVLLGGWFAVMGIVGAFEANWLWPVLAAVPAAYFLGLPALAEPSCGARCPGGGRPPVLDALAVAGEGPRQGPGDRRVRIR